MNKRNRIPKAIWIIALLATIASPTWANQTKGIPVGGEMPPFSLKDTTGAKHALGDLKGKVAVLIFTSQECPWSRGADPGLNALAKKYKAKGVAFLGINSHRDTKPDAISDYAKANEVTYPILKDRANRYADKVNARVTPEIFVVDKKGRVVYHGAFDDRKGPNDTGATNYLANALDSVLAGKAVSQPEVKAWGCGIKRVKKKAAGGYGGSGSK